jgi:2-methylcitrate dehydratase PrpD
LSETLAAWVVSLDWDAIPQDQRDLVGLRVLDTVGLVFAGRSTDAACAALDMVEAEGGTAEATLLVDGARLPAPQAAFAHALVAHCRDFDDTFLDSVVHPGSVVVSAALAAGEAHEADDATVASAIVAGYEIAARLGAAAGRDFHARGFHATGIVGPFAAAAAIGRIMGLSADAMADAFGLAASMAGGLMAFVEDGAWSKWLHAGHAAQAGFTAARLAARGFRGPRGAIGGRYGFYGAFLHDPERDLTGVAAGLGERWAGGEAHFKYYPCAHVIQPYIDAALTLRREHGLTAGAVEEAVCAIAPWAVPIVCEPRAPRIAPEGEMDAIASLPFQVAAALADGSVTLSILDADTRARADLRDLAARVIHCEDPALGHGFDGALEIVTRDGRRLSAPATSAPPDRDRIVAKFRANAGVPPDLAEAVEQAVLGRSVPSFGRLSKLPAGK